MTYTCSKRVGGGGGGCGQSQKTPTWCSIKSFDSNGMYGPKLSFARTFLSILLKLQDLCYCMCM